jgi:hypothetical protein
MKIETAGTVCQPLVCHRSTPDLSASATTVESASAMDGCTVKSTADCSMTYVSMTHISAVEPARRSTMIEASSAIVAASVAPARASIVAASPAISVVPRSGADEQAVYEPARSVVSVRSARIGRVIIVAIRTGGRPGDVSGAKSHAHANSDLRLRLDQRKRHQHTQQQKVFKVAHCSSPFFPDSSLSFLRAPQPNLKAFAAFSCSRSAYTFERGRPEKVSGSGVADFSHAA